MTIDVIGYYDANNNGDDALQLAIKKMLHGVDLAFPKYATSKKVILGGGDVVNQFFLDRIPKDSELYLLGCGLGYETELDLLKDYNIKEALFRNKKDAELAAAKGINASYTPDLVFALEPSETRLIDIKRVPPKKLLGVMVADNVSSSYSQKDPRQIGYGQYLKAELADALLYLSEWYKIVFIPMSHAPYAYDTKMFYEIMSYMPPRHLDKELLPPLGAMEVIDVVSQMDLIITMRFHGVIYSTLTGTPFVNIGLTRKTQLFCHEHLLGDLCVAPMTFTTERLCAAIKTAEQNYTKPKIKAVKALKIEEIAAVTDKVRGWVNA